MAGWDGGLGELLGGPGSEWTRPARLTRTPAQTDGFPSLIVVVVCGISRVVASVWLDFFLSPLSFVFWHFRIGNFLLRIQGRVGQVLQADWRRTLG